MAQKTSTSLVVSDQRAERAPPPARLFAVGELRSWSTSVLIHGLSLAAMALVLLPQAERRPVEAIDTEIAQPESPVEFLEVLPTVMPEGAEELTPSSAAAGGADGGELASVPHVPGDEVQQSPTALKVPEGVLALPVPVRAERLHGPAARKLGVGGNALVGLLGGRGEGMKGRLLKEYGGSEASEHAVDLGLDWLARHQNDDGSWSLDGFGKLCNGACSGPGLASDTAATALGVLPFLGAGHTHKKGPYKTVVRKALEWLSAYQRSEGNLISGRGSMYSHGLASIALCEAYAMTQDSRLRPAAQQALEFIALAQDPVGGGWRYVPRQRGDTSVAGWQLMALFSGRMGELEVSPAVKQRASRFLDSVAADATGGSYVYMAGWETSPVMTAEALLCRMYLGWPREHPGIVRGVRWLLEEHPPDVRPREIYYWYYATQVMHHMGGETWQRWNAKMRDLLVGTQLKRGHSAGSWDPPGIAEDFHSAAGGRLMMTSLAMLTLEAYYRHLPLYDRQRIEEWAQRDAATEQPTFAAGP